MVILTARERYCLGGCLALIAVGTLLGALCWPYSVNTWLSWADKDPILCWWHGALIGAVPVFGQLALPAAIVTWIINLAL